MEGGTLPSSGEGVCEMTRERGMHGPHPIHEWSVVEQLGNTVEVRHLGHYLR